MRISVPFVAVLAVALMAVSSSAQIVDFVETFDNDSADFSDFSDNPATFVPATATSSAFISTSNNFEDGIMGNTTTRVENQNGFLPSGGAFFGDYISDEVTTVRFDIRHDFNQALDFNVRIAPGSNFPGAFLTNTIAIQPGNEFQEFRIDIQPSNFGFEGAPNPGLFAFVFSDVQNFQIFTSAPEGVTTGTFQVDIDNFEIITAAANNTDPLLGDVNQDGEVNFSDIAPFISRLQSGDFLTEADINEDGVVDFSDIPPFIEVLSSN